MEHILHIFALIDLSFLAQVDLSETVDKGLSILTTYSIILCTGGLIIAGFLIIRGQIEFAIFAIIGSLTIGSAAVVSKSLISLFNNL